MKTNRVLSIILAVSTFPAMLSTAQPSSKVASDHLEKAETVIGMKITDRNQTVGKVREMAIDWNNARIAEVIVDTGGFITSRQRIIALPPQTLTLSQTGGELRMNGDIDAFENAPEFDASAWNDSTSAESVMDLYNRFHIRPYDHIGALTPSGKILDLTIRNTRNERLGKLNDLVVSLPEGDISFVIVASKGMFARNNSMTAVPPQAFYFSPEDRAIILDTTKEALKNAPHFKSDDWRNGINRFMNASAADNALNVLHSPSYQTEGDTSVNTRTGEEMQADVAITAEIEHKIMAAEGLSINARNTLVQTSRGFVTLRGVADSDKEKQRVGEIAASVVPPDHVMNLIQVKALAIR